MEKEHVDKYIFYVCLAVSIILFIVGVVTPPPGIIDNSVLTAGGILFGFATLGIFGQNLAHGKGVSWRKGDMEIQVGDSNIEDDENDKEES